MKNEKEILIGLNGDYYTHYYLTKNLELQVILVGRLTKDVELKKKGNKIIGDLKLAVPRPFKNEEGIFETDFIPCTVYGEIAKHTSEYCKKGDIIGIKGRLQTFKAGEKTELFITAEKVTFLQSANKEENKNE